MRTHTAVVVAALALSVPAARAGEGPKPPAHLAPDAIARLYLSEQPGDRAAADRGLEGASPAVLREVLDEVRRASDDFGMVPNARIPQEALDKGVGVAIESRWVALPPEEVKAIVPGGDRDVGTSRLRTLAPRDVERILAAIRDGRDGASVGTSGATTVDGYRTSSSQTNRVAYVASYEWKKGADGQEIADPVTGTVSDGVDVVVTPHVSQDLKRVDLDLKTRVRKLIRPILVEKAVPPGPGRAVDVQRPEVLESRWARTTTVPSGGTALVFLPDGYAAPGLRLMLLVTATYVDLNAPAKPK